MVTIVELAWVEGFDAANRQSGGSKGYAVLAVLAQPEAADVFHHRGRLGPIRKVKALSFVRLPPAPLAPFRLYRRHLFLQPAMQIISGRSWLPTSVCSRRSVKDI